MNHNAFIPEFNCGCGVQKCLCTKYNLSYIKFIALTIPDNDHFILPYILHMVQHSSPITVQLKNWFQGNVLGMQYGVLDSLFLNSFPDTLLHL